MTAPPIPPLTPHEHAMREAQSKGERDWRRYRNLGRSAAQAGAAASLVDNPDWDDWPSECKAAWLYGWSEFSPPDAKVAAIKATVANMHLAMDEGREEAAAAALVAIQALVGMPWVPGWERARRERLREEAAGPR